MITFIIPTRNNFPYLKLAYNSIRKFYPSEEIIILDDNSTDETVGFFYKKMTEDPNLVYDFIKMPNGHQVGHTILYDMGVKMSKNDIFTIFHADMVCGPNYVENLLKHLKPGSVVAATRIEPPLHPPGQEKIVMDFGTYDTDFKQESFETFCLEKQREFKDTTSKGIFAPWAMYKKDFQSIGGHDSWLSPFPYEDSDIFQRFILAGYNIQQSRDSFVYHFTCRGHRWTEQVQKDDLFYKLCCAKNMSHFIRKWGHWIQNDENCYPIVHKKYNIGVYIKNCNPNLLPHIEPWFTTTYADCETSPYINNIQPGTPFDMLQRVKPLLYVTPDHDVEISFDGSLLNSNEKLQTLTMLPKMIEDSGEIGDMEYDIFNIKIRKLVDLSPNLINNNSEWYQDQMRALDGDPYCTNELFKVFEQVKSKNQ